MYNLTSSFPFTGQLHQSDSFNDITISSYSLDQSHLTFQVEEITVFSQLSSDTREDIENKVKSDTVLDDFIAREKSLSRWICPKSIKS